MANIEQHFAQVQTITADLLSDELFRFIRSMEKYLVNLNREQINKNSEDIHGRAIGFYSKATEVLSGGEKRAGQPFTGKDTGSWLDAFYMGVSNNVFYFGSSDPKTDDILNSESWLSKDLFGLTEDNLYVFIKKEVLPFMIAFNRKRLGIS